MIEQLMVKDYILFDQALIDFSTGMSVITGETGAGKSLLIDAIGYICGDRVGSNIVRKGKDKCVLQLVLSKPSNSICEQLEEDGFDVDDSLIIQRIITSAGKSTIRINMMNTTLGYVKNLMSQLIDVHSQMDTYLLMNEDVQLELLDQFAKVESLKEKVSNAYDTYAHCKKEYDTALNQTFSDDELDFVTQQYNEIVDANIYENELEELQEKIKLAQSFQKNIDDFNNSIYLLDKENGILEQVYSVYKIISKNDLFENVSSSMNDEYYRLEALCEDLKAMRDQYQMDVEDLDALQEREYFIRKLFRKHGGSYESMKEDEKNYLNKIDLILHRQDLFERLEKECTNAKNAYYTLANQLHKKRESVFKTLSKQIETHCKDLMLENAKFKIDCKEKNPSKDGIDKIEFMVSMNPGSPFSSLKKSASGGELSRLMLALKVVFQTNGDIETIIFDEIDTGVSGKVALSMGNKMHALSSKYQVLCITHLASVACWADTHLRVSKMSKKDVTTTRVDELDDTQSVEELAIMASGNASKEAIESAIELKKRVRNG